MQDEFVQYYVVNKELGMSVGKVAAQVAHAASGSVLRILQKQDKKELEYLNRWANDGFFKKIVLKASQKELEKLEEKGFLAIHDAGLTEIPENSLTVVALNPMPKSEAQAYVKRLQLLKDKL